MRLAIINITSGGMSAGYKKYLRELLSRLALTPDVSTIFCAYSQSINVLDIMPKSPKTQNILFRPSVMVSRVKKQLYRRLKDFDPDVLFFPSAHSFTFDSIPTLSMLQNMEPMVQVEGNPCIERLINFARKQCARRSIKKASGVIAISDYVRQFMAKKWGTDLGRIRLIYLGVSQPDTYEFTNPPISVSWDGGFLFTAGSIRPARGLEDLLVAMKTLRELSLGLVIAGEVDIRMEGYKKKLDKYIETHGLADRIIWAGKLSAQDMSWCYRACQAFVMTSRAEACPNTVLEAMAHGCLCVSTETRPMPEFFEGNAVYYPPGNADALANAIGTMLNWSDPQRTEASKKARQRAAQFSWDVCAERTVQELKKATEGYNCINGRKA